MLEPPPLFILILILILYLAPESTSSLSVQVCERQKVLLDTLEMLMKRCFALWHLLSDLGCYCTMRDYPAGIPKAHRLLDNGDGETPDKAISATAAAAHSAATTAVPTTAPKGP